MRQLVHRYWTGAPHPLVDQTRNALRAVTNGEIIEWSDETLPEECLAEVAAGQGKVVPRDAIRHRANIIRWWLLLNYGGYTIHHDMFLISPLNALPFPVTASHDRLRCTAFMGLPAGTDIARFALEAIRQAPVSDTARAPAVSGERLLTHLAGDIPRLMHSWDRNGVRRDIQPWSLFLRFPKERYRQNIGEIREARTNV